MPSTCIFEFDRPNPIYYSGETINGRIQLHTTNEKRVREVYILFIGEAKTHWKERRSRTVNGKTEYYYEHFRGTETYLNTRTAVAGEGSLQPGTYTYTFCIPLPILCPTSCVEEYGRIHYEISLVLNRPLRFDNEFSKPLTVIKQLNLNNFPELLIPIKGEDIKYFCCWPCSSGPVISTLTIPFGGYAPGQKIKYTIEIDNKSAGYDLHDINMKLMQHYKFTAHSPRYKTRERSTKLAGVSQNASCLRLTKRVYEGELLIPPIPPSSKSLSTIIEVYYTIVMSINTGSCHTDAETSIPITIGTVPLIQSATNVNNALALQAATAPEISDSLDTADGPPSYEFYKPPSFEEATTIEGKFVDPDANEHHKDEPFIPKYPMYTNFAMPTAPPIGFNNSEMPLLPTSSNNYSQDATAPPPYSSFNDKH